MRRAMRIGLLTLVVGVMCTPEQVFARAYVNPWGGVIFGNDQAQAGFRSFGVSFGDASHSLVGTETTFGFSPGFFGSGVENYVMDLMAGVTVGPTIVTKAKRDIRPYGLIAFGTVRTSIDDLGSGPGLKRNDLALSIGGGATMEMNDRLALRADVRYFRTLGADEAANALNVSFADFHYWRTAIGVIIH